MDVMIIKDLKHFYRHVLILIINTQIDNGTKAIEEEPIETKAANILAIATSTGNELHEDKPVNEPDGTNPRDWGGFSKRKFLRK